MRWLRHIRAGLEVAVTAIFAVLLLNGGEWVSARAWITFDLTLAALGVCVAWLAVTLLLGRVYCSSMCPLGTLQDLVAWLAKRATARGWGNYRYRPGDWRLRGLTLTLIAVSLTADNGHIAALTDPTALARTAVTALPLWQRATADVMLGVIAAGVILLAVMWMAWRDGRSFCNTICPVGTVLGAAGAMALMRPEINPDLCVGCGKCEQECKAQCVDHLQRTIDTSRCVMCLNCIAECPNRAITYRAGRHRLQNPLMMHTPQMGKLSQRSPT